MSSCGLWFARRRRAYNEVGHYRQASYSSYVEDRFIGIEINQGCLEVPDGERGLVLLPARWWTQ
jgi:hypothetical protein